MSSGIASDLNANPAEDVLLKLENLLEGVGPKSRGLIDHAFRIKRTEAIPLAIELIHSDKGHWGFDAVYGLNFLASLGEKAPTEVFVEALNDRRAGVVKAALTALGSTKNPKFLSLILTYIDRQEYAAAATRALTMMETTDACKSLLAKRNASRDEFFIMEWVWSVGEIGCLESKDEILRLRDRTKDDYLRQRCEIALDKIDLLGRKDRSGALLDKVKNNLLADVSDERFDWSLKQMRSLNMKQTLPKLREFLNTVKKHDSEKYPEKNWTIASSDGAFELALTIHALGGKLEEDEEAALRLEGLIE